MDKPFLHLFIFSKIKKGSRCDIVDKTYLKEVIGRVLIRKGGLPRHMVKYIIDDLVELELLEEVNNREVYKLKADKSTKKVEALLNALSL